jgi:acetyltransferase-like isoleucine patch superfamily enzyme
MKNRVVFPDGGFIEASKIKCSPLFKIGRNSCIIADEIEIEDGVTIGEDTQIHARFVHVGFQTIIEERCKVFSEDSFVMGEQGFLGHDSKILVPVFKIGDYVRINNHAFINGLKPITLGDYVWVGQNGILNGLETLTIGNGVGIGTYSSIWTHGGFGELLEGCTLYKIAPVVIEDDVWLVGSYNVVSPGVRIGRRAVVMTGSVVTRDIPPNRCFSGNPAKDITDKFQPYRQLTLEEKWTMLRGFIDEFVATNFGTKSNVIEDGWLVNTHEGLAKIIYRERVFDTDINPDELCLIFTQDNQTQNLTGHTTIFDVSTKLYTKCRTALEVQVIKALLYSKARFYPR